MPMNEAAGFRRSNLTTQQKNAEIAAIYGVKEQVMAPQLSHEEIESMRQLLAAHDAQNRSNGVKEFDLNNPPKLPYSHQEYPRLVYHHEKNVQRVAHNDKELAALTKKGFKKEPATAPRPADEFIEELLSSEEL